jgi:hypothetical protein
LSSGNLLSRVRTIDALLVGLAALFGLGLIIAQIVPRPPIASPRRHEAFDPALESVRSLDGAAGYVLAEQSSRDPKALADAADEFGRQRFFHAYSFFEPRQNWLAYLAGFLWIDLRSPVLPDDILKHPSAACSQQVIVFEALARRLGLDAASVRMDEHMAAAVKIRGEWQVYDADREINPRSYPLAKLAAGDPAVLAIYGSAGQQLDLRGQAASGQIHLTDVNRNPALHASLFHRITRVLSDYGWLLFGCLAALRLWIRRSARAKAPRVILAA